MERGQPFLRLLEAIKNCEVEPLNRIAKVAEEKLSSIYINETLLKPHLKKESKVDPVNFLKCFG